MDTQNILKQKNTATMGAQRRSADAEPSTSTSPQPTRPSYERKPSTERRKMSNLKEKRRRGRRHYVLAEWFACSRDSGWSNSLLPPVFASLQHETLTTFVGVGSSGCSQAQEFLQSRKKNLITRASKHSKSPQRSTPKAVLPGSPGGSGSGQRSSSASASATATALSSARSRDGTGRRTWDGGRDV